MTNDLDYFHDEERLVAEAFAADSKILESKGYSVVTTLSQPGFIRALIGQNSDATKVEWAHDSAWRFLPPIPDSKFDFWPTRFGLASDG